MNLLLRSLAYTALFLTLATPGAAQVLSDSAGTIQPSTVQAAAQPVAPAVAEAQPQGLPRRAPEPRTLQEFWPVFAIFATVWLGIIVYVLRFGAPLRKITASMSRVENGGES